MDRRVQENGFGRWIGMVLLVWIDFVIGLETGANGLLFRKDAEALLEFKNGVTGDPMGVLKGWILNNDGKVDNPCDWKGVSCSQWRVTMVDLGNAGLSGNLWAGKILSGLDKLDSLVLRGNNFTGDLGSKQKLGSACSVSTLDLSDNSLSGNFAMDFFSVCQSLVSLNISHNYLTTASMAVGRGAVSFGPSIQVLDISHNLLSDDSVLSGIITNCQNLKHLDLSYNRINGSLPPGIGQCTQLVSLNLSSNLFTDRIPTDLIVSSRNTKCSAGNCSIGSSLQVLDLSNNNLSGPLSALQLGDLCANLTVINLSSNALTGKIPPSLGNCKDLKLLNLSANLLFGTIPAALGDLNSIEQLLIFKNKLNGNIPPELGNICPTLKELDLSSNNNISGPIPSSFALCSSLDTINLSNNQLFGNFLGDLLGNLHSLRVLLLSYNNLTGSIPLSLANCSRLEVLDLSSNNISGTIPPDICTPSSSLQRLFLPNNFLTGSLPPELVKCHNLRTIDFSFNYLNGTIPAILGSLPYLQDLVIWLNQLEGPIPDKICDSGSLETLILNNNFLTGEVPSSLMKCPNLGWISLSSNRLSGNIPSSLGHLNKLAILQLGNNSLSGAIPPELGNCSSLIWLDLNSNMLSGSIPPELSQQSGHIVAGNVAGKLFAFVRNEGGTACRGAGGLLEFAGIRPEQLSRSPMLHSCDFTRVYLGTTMYRFTDNGTLIYFDLSYNSLSGTIPEGIGSLYYVTVFNLGHNLITGTIPSSLGGLKQVGVLDLSHNMLHGFIPGSLGGLSFLSDFDVSNNNLTGPIPSSGQFMTFPSSRYENNSGLCGLPLPACGSNEGSTDGEGSAVPSPGHRDRRNGALAGSVAMGLLLALSCILGLIVIAVKTKKQKNQEDMRDKYMDSLPTSGSGSWKLSGVLEPLSINVATFEKPLRKLTFAHLLEATNGFSADSLIGSGGFGDVYKAQLKDGSIVAIKKLIHVSGQGDREFTAEMETIGKIKHRNLVPLLGYCKIGEERLLVYEYMKWGSLETVLHEKIRGSTALDWATRKKVAIGSARGLAFLHHSCIPHIIHRDMKSSNVLLDENMEARVSDFGMARLMNALDTHLSVSTLAGTPGYVPPEYYQSFRCTTKGDVYSYGVILLELLSGRRPIDPVEFGDNNLVGWMKQHVKLKRASDVFDPVLIQDRHVEQDMYQHLRIACECLDDRPWRRPTMIQVLAMFRELQTDGEAELDGFTLPEDVDIHEETSS